MGLPGLSPFVCSPGFPLPPPPKFSPFHAPPLSFQVKKNNEEEILQILRSLKEKYNDEETLLRKADDIIMFQPNFMGVGIDIKKLVKKLFSR
jgi:hypothetical protein